MPVKTNKIKQNRGEDTNSHRGGNIRKYSLNATTNGGEADKNKTKKETY